MNSDEIPNEMDVLEAAIIQMEFSDFKPNWAIVPRRMFAKFRLPRKLKKYMLKKHGVIIKPFYYLKK